MNKLSLLYKTGLLNLTKNKIEKWYRMQDTDKLIFALENGLYNIRILAAKYLGNIKDKKAIGALRKSLNDNVQVVSVESANSLKKLTENIEIKKEIDYKLKYWKLREEEIKKNSNKHRHFDIPKWEKRDWVAIIKEQLKRPMR